MDCFALQLTEAFRTLTKALFQLDSKQSILEKSQTGLKINYSHKSSIDLLYKFLNRPILPTNSYISHSETKGNCEYETVTRLFGKSYKKTHPQKRNLAKRTWELAKEATFSLLLETDFFKLLISSAANKKPQIPFCFTDYSSLWFVF